LPLRINFGLFPREFGISPYENADLSQSRESLGAAAAFFGFETRFEIQLYFTSPESVTEIRRGQKDAFKIILCAKETLTQQSSKQKRLRLIVSNHDLFANGMNFVFGLADADLGIGVVSTYRLTRWVEDLTPSKIQERIFKESAHEIGHLVGLQHCQNESCMMSFSENIAQVDSKLPLLCKDCSRRVGQR